MCKMKGINVGIKKLLTDGREIILPLSFFPDIKNLPLKKRLQWMILDDQFFTFEGMSKVYSVVDLLRL